MHVLMTVNSAWNIYNFRLPVLDQLLSEGHKVTILAPQDDAVGKLIERGCTFISLRMDAAGLNPLNDFLLIRRLKRIFHRERPDVILSYTIKNNIFGGFAARSLNIPFIPNISGLGTAFLSGGLIQKVAEKLYRRAFEGVPTVFFQNLDDKELFIQRRLIRSHQAKILPGSGINLEHFSPAPMPEHVSQTSFLMIARLLRDKGVLEFVDAARIMRAQGCDARFKLLGATGAKNRTAISSDLISQWTDEGVVEYLGQVSDVRPHIAEADCVVLPSYREGSPRTLIEAAAMARPLIATNVPGCKDVIEDRTSGLLCAVRDSKSLAKAFESFMSLSINERAAMGEAGRKRMERDFDQRHIVAAYNAAIEGALQ